MATPGPFLQPIPVLCRDLGVPGRGLFWAPAGGSQNDPPMEKRIPDDARDACLAAPYDAPDARLPALIGIPGCSLPAGLKLLLGQ